MLKSKKIRILIIFLLFILLIIFLGKGNPRYTDQEIQIIFKEYTGFNDFEIFKRIDYDYSGSITDYSETYIYRLSPRDYKLLLQFITSESNIDQWKALKNHYQFGRAIKNNEIGAIFYTFTFDIKNGLLKVTITEE